MDGRTYAGVTHNRLRKAAQRALSPGQWKQYDHRVIVGGRFMAACAAVSDGDRHIKGNELAQHIAAANPAAVLAMLERIQELEGQLAAATSAINGVLKEAVTIMNRNSEMAAAVILARAALLAAGWDEGCEAIRLIDTLMAKAKGGQL